MLDHSLGPQAQFAAFEAPELWFWGIISELTPTVAPPNVYEVTHALDLIRRNAELPPGELRLLAYLVAETLAGRGPGLHQKSIAADVFGRDITTFDPRTDSIVRTTAANLRHSLQAYYAGSGQSDPLTIELIKGTYLPAFCPRAPLSPQTTSRLWSARTAMEARTSAGYEVAIGHLDVVLAEAPSLSLALALKAEALASQAIHGARPRPNLDQARALAARAMDQPRPVWQAWLSQGIVQQALEWNWASATESYRRALDLGGTEAAAHVWYTAFLVGRGRPKEGISHLQRAVDHFGYSNPTCIGDLSMLLMLSRDYEAAGAAISAALEAAPRYYQHHLNRAILLEAQGDPAGALRVLDQTPLPLLERPVTWGLRALFAGFGGSTAVARRRLSWLRTIGKTGRYIPHSQVAACWLGAGNPDEAVRSLERAAEDRDPLAVWFWAYPMFRRLHGHGGFERLIDQIGLIRY
jgi:tetratricopeptide (TPR) repeat protein